MFEAKTMYSLFGKGYSPARKRTRLSKQDHSTVIERGRGVEFHLQDVEFDDDDIPGRVVKFPVYRSPPFLSPDGMAVFTVLPCNSRVDCMDTLTRNYFIVRHSLTDGQGSYFRVTEFEEIHSPDHMRYSYALSHDRLGALVIDSGRQILHQYVIRIGHQPRLAEVIAHRSFPIENPRSWYFKTSLQLDDRIMLPSESSPILILAADIEAPESNKYCHCCRLDGYVSRLEIEARNRNVPPPSFGTLTLGRNGVYVCVRPEYGMGSFCVLGLEWQRNNELPVDLCHRRVEDTVPVFYRFDQQFANIDDGCWFQVVSNGLVALTYLRKSLHDRNRPGPKWIMLDVFVLDLTRLVRGDAHPEMHCTQSTISRPAHESLWNYCLNLIPGTSSVVVGFHYSSSFLRLQSAFDVPPLRQLAFEALYKHMKPEERSKPGWMQTLCGFECV